MRLKNQIALIVAALIATTSLAWGQQSAESSRNRSLVGTWQVLRHGVNCSNGKRLNPDFHSLMTFNQCGTLNGYAVGPGDSPATTSPEYGIWSRIGNSQTYTFRDVGFGYDDNGAFNGRGEITANLTLDGDGDSFTADVTVDIFDADGNFLFSFCGKHKGTRFK